MNQELVIFTSSLIFAGMSLYMLGLVWFGDRRNHLTGSFFLMGLSAVQWLVLNSIILVIDRQHFPVVFTLRMIAACIFPFALLWSSLNFTKSSWAQKKWFVALLVIIPAVDIIMVATAPMHGLYLTDYAHPRPGKGLMFWVHAWIAIIVVLMSYVHVIRHVIKRGRGNTLMMWAGMSMLIPCVLNVLHILHVPAFKYDHSPMGFILTFFLLSFSSHKSRKLRFKLLPMERVFSSLGDMVFLFDQQGIVLERNLAAGAMLPQYPDRELSILDVLDDIERKLVSCVPDNLLAGIRLRQFDGRGELSVDCGSEGIKTYALDWHAVKEKGVLDGFVLSLTDTSAYRNMIDEINKNNERLIALNVEAVAASEAKSAFLANMSHEIRTPLNAIIGMAHVARKSSGDPQKMVTCIDEVLSASDHLLGLINDVLDISKIEAGKFLLNNEPFALRTAMREVRDLFVEYCGAKNLQLISDIDALPNPMVIGDKLRLKQAIINLLGNAVKFTPTGGAVKLCLAAIETPTGLMLNVNVSDTGIGMSQSQMNRLFSAFDQTDNKISSKYGGTGLGLSISQHLIGLMGGLIGVNSAPGAGSAFSFSITLPIAEGVMVDECERQNDALDFSGKRMLVVDDVEVNRVIIKELLQPLGLIIDEAHDGHSALDIFARAPINHYDLIFMDVQMPGIDGYEATRRLRKLDRADARSIAVIAMTANAYREDVEKAFDAGMNGHLPKPIDVNEMNKLIGRVFSYSPQLPS